VLAGLVVVGCLGSYKSPTSDHPVAHVLQAVEDGDGCGVELQSSVSLLSHVREHLASLSEYFPLIKRETLHPARPSVKYLPDKNIRHCHCMNRQSPLHSLQSWQDYRDLTVTLHRLQSW